MAARRIRGWWWVDFRAQRVRYRKRSPANSKGCADAYERFLQGELAEHGSLDHVFKPPPRPVTFAEFAERWMREYVEVNNRWSERRTKAVALAGNLLPAFGRLVLPQITAERVEQYKAAELAADRSPKTINNRLTILRKCLVTASEWGVLAAVPRIRFLKAQPPTVRFLSETQLQALLAAAAPDLRLMILVAVRTGLRLSELLALEWGDIDLERAFLCVQRATVLGHVDAPKNNRIRHVPLTNELLAALRPERLATGLVFQRAGRPVSYYSARRRLARACRRAGLSRVGWHQMRHSFASHLVSRGASLKAVQDLLGHQSMDMTLRYAHLASDVLREAVSLLEPGSPEFWAPGGHVAQVVAAGSRTEVPRLAQQSERHPVLGCP